MEDARIKACDAPDAAPFRQDPVPEILNTGADACYRTDACDDRASSTHALTLFALDST